MSNACVTCSRASSPSASLRLGGSVEQHGRQALLALGITNASATPVKRITSGSYPSPDTPGS